jgi:hypothetical protein
MPDAWLHVAIALVSLALGFLVPAEPVEAARTVS